MTLNSRHGSETSSTTNSGTGGLPSQEASRLRLLIENAASEVPLTYSFSITKPTTLPSSTTRPNAAKPAPRKTTLPNLVGTPAASACPTKTSSAGSVNASPLTSTKTGSRSTPTQSSNVYPTGSRLERLTSSLFPNTGFKNAVLWCSASFAAGILSVCFLAIPLPNGNTFSEPTNASSTGW